MGYGHAVDELWDAQAPFTVALVDPDNLKYANDAFGHDEGNHYILTVAELLRACRREGDGSGAYRIGGDEFVLISPRDTESSLASRLEKARDELVEKSTATEPMTFSFSYGCSKVHPDEGGSRKDITADADRKMYRYKLAHRSAQQRMRNVPGAAAARGGDFNARFFTERVFEALAMAVPERYQFVIDIESDRSRWSANAVTDLGIPSANLENKTKVWGEHVHADDLSAYLEGAGELLQGKTHHLAAQYRARDAAGSFMVCECRAFRLDGNADAGIPSLIAGVITNRSIAENTDLATGLGDIRSLMAAVDDCRYGQDSCGLLGIKVDGVAEINATLGYEAGDRALSLLSARLLSVLRGRGLAYRARGSEFVALVRGGCERDVVELRQEVSAQLDKPLRFEGEELPVSMRYAVVFLDLVDRQPLPILNDLDQRLREGASTLGRAGDGQGNGREGSQAGDAHAPSRRGVGLGQARTAGEKRLDPLTGLLCSSDFIETAREWCRANPAEQWAFVALDIDNLPIFYEWHGKEEGKLLVSEVAGVLRGMQGESKLCAGYWGEDDFSLLVALDQELLDEVYRRVREVVASHDSSVGFLPSMGVYTLESAQELGDDCYAKASFANTQGKEHFETRIWFFRAADWKRQFDEHLMLSDFHYALRQGRIGFVLQPQVVLGRGSICGAEALARWRTDDVELDPEEFIPVLERTGFIVMLDKYIWKSVVAWLRDQLRRGFQPVPISFNISPVDVATLDVPEHLGKLLKAEVPESLFLQDPDAAHALVSGLKKMGIGVFLDEFGNSLGSLALLREAGVDAVKLDQGLLVAGAEKDGRRAGIADPLLSLAREAGVSVIADDVQTERQVDALRGSGIRYIQGYVYYLPMSPADLESLLANTLLVERAGIVALGEQGAKEPPAKDAAFRKGFFAR